MVKIVCLSIFHAGRIDSPVLAKRASLVPFIGEFADVFASLSPCISCSNEVSHYALCITCTRLGCPGFLIDDTAPNFFIQDCLLHEAVCFYLFIPPPPPLPPLLPGVSFCSYLFFKMCLTFLNYSTGTHTLNC